MRSQLIIFVFSALFSISLVKAQVGINTTSPDLSSALDVSSTDKGILVPRMTQAQRIEIASPATGLLVYQIDNTNGFWYYDGVTWVSLGVNSNTGWTVSGNNVFSSLLGNVGIGAINPSDKLVVSGGRVEFTSNTDATGNQGSGVLEIDNSLRIDGNEIITNDNATFYLQRDNNGDVEMGLSTFVAKTATNQVGIGTTSPSATLDVNGTFKLVDGNQGDSKVLTSDANGNATWQTAALSGEFQRFGSVVRNTSNIATDDFVFGSPSLDNLPGTLDSGRFFFDKSKGAFRAGITFGNEWDDSNVGNFSIALGRRNIARGIGSLALGYESTANGDESNALGSDTTANGYQSTAMGVDNISHSFAETVLGLYASDYNPNSVNSFNSTDRLFTVGNGESSELRSDAIVVLKNGHVSLPASRNATSSPGTGVLEIANSLRLDGNEIITNNGVALRLQTGNNSDLIVDGTTFVVDASANNVGIGTPSPTQAKLVVNGSVSTNLGDYRFINLGTSSINISNIPSSYSIYATHNIATPQINVFSDQRIKNIKGISNTKTDLETLAQIEITDYTLKDCIGKGYDTIKKVIAQQVKEVYPQAVSDDLTDVIPDIYQLAEINDGWINLNTDLAIGDRVKLIFSKTEEVLAVTEVSKNSFKVDSEQVGKVFVFGKEVKDFHTVDYDALSMLNVSATQELLKRIVMLEAENTNLKADNLVLKSENTQQNTYLKSLDHRIQQLEAQSQNVIN
jgi:hypothetical protein